MERSSINWRHRPDVQAVSKAVQPYIDSWGVDTVAGKLLPLLVEWDLRQGPSRLQADDKIAFEPISITKMSAAGRMGRPAAAGREPEDNAPPPAAKVRLVGHSGMRCLRCT